MFRKRRSASHHQQPLSTSNAQSAQSAASHAFQKSQPSSSSLSSAAAAAALRSLTPTPIPVENVQTKRMIQRRASVASQLSLPGNMRPSSQNALRRANSSSSMSTRTFREQSPRRPASCSGPVLIAPPIPSIPREFAMRTLPNRRSVSVGPSMRLASPTTRQPSGREVRVGPDVRGPVGQPSARSHGLNQMPELEGAGSKNSINFSYPMNSRPNSPTLAPEPLDRRDTSACASLVSQLLSPDFPKVQKPAHQTANTSARRKTREVISGSPRGITQPVDTAILAAQAAIVTRNDETPYQPSPPRLAAHRAQNSRDQASGVPTAHQTHDRPVQHQPRDHVLSQRFPESDNKRLPSHPVSTKRSSTVPEDWQGAEPVEAGAPVEGTEPEPVERSLSETRPTVRTPTPEMLKNPLLSSTISSPESPSSVGPDRESQLLQARPTRGSPGRSTRFSNRLSVIGFAGEHLHQPPPRSVSPAKSAMKNPRKCSLSLDGGTCVVLRPGPALSELSDGTSVGSDEGSRPAFRRKPVKVSFDDEAEVVGGAASPPTSPEDIGFESPSAKLKGRMSSFGMNKRKPATVGSEAFDEVFKPRPVLPSFGSIRRSRNGKQEPAQQDISDNESTASSEPNMSPRSFSNDHAIGAILLNTQSRDTHLRAQADRTVSLTTATAAESRTSTERLGEKRFVTQGDSKTAQDPQPEQLESYQEEKQDSTQNLAMPVQPAPLEVEKGRSSLDWYTVPGGFPRSSLELDSTSHDSTKWKGKKQSLGDTAIDTTLSDDESGESIYSDAEEGFEGDGFGSINAVIGEPTSGQHKDVAEMDAATDGNARGIDQVAPSLLDIPQTCQIARVVNPVHAISLSPVPEYPSSSHEQLPYSSPYPPFPNSRTDVRESPRSSIATDTVRRSMLVNAHDSRPVREATISAVHGPLQPQSEIATYQPRHKAGYEPTKKRPTSWAPNLLKCGITGLDDEPHVNGKNSGPQRPWSNGSDSSSSFKRSNRPRTDSPRTIRRTLRGHSTSSSRGCSPHGARSRPTNSRPLSSGSGTGTLRATLRSSDPRREKPAFFSTGKVQAARITKASGALFTSRFAESDDEQGMRQQRWQSRFEDSSDDEARVVNNLPPVRGIPRREGAHDGDSTELEDSSDNEQSASATVSKGQATNVSTTRNAALAAVAKSRGMTEEEMEEFLRQPSGRRSSLLHRLSIRKPKAPPERGASRSLPQGRNGFLDPSLVREDLVLDGSRGNTITTITTNNIRPTSSPRRLRRGISKSSNGDSWLLRADRKEANIDAPSLTLRSSERPKTADGAFRNGSTAPNIVDSGTRKANLAATDAPDVLDVGFASSRKKRFPRLRKAFGLQS
ncbi:hypothetical protein BDV28DRAFT_152150 [Aspergillus coremiiformis]|uniref:Uncharacterized protein n=1 Tax=Aspergillus coremiiformis TaxID=138285 RepID=A0A5N6YUJ8_9EURO|nr:hypothetical protein BDV28DRAFT_152150 [Aspergillus coremiiformis]